MENLEYVREDGKKRQWENEESLLDLKTLAVQGRSGHAFALGS
jgi:hypothetical protein